ncbi:hypothetical protein TURU_163649 [Turdus rufiventris]|nr:hypothetical protein TURU_163649 [Turdus rufiventris]
MVLRMHEAMICTEQNIVFPQETLDESASCASLVMKEAHGADANQSFNSYNNLLPEKLKMTLRALDITTCWIWVTIFLLKVTVVS